MWFLLLWNICFNAVLVGLLYVWGYVFVHFNHLKSLPAKNYLMVGFFVSIVFALLGFSLIGHQLIRLFVNARAATLAELEKINPCLEAALDKFKLKYGLSYVPQKLKILISDIKEPGFQIFGRKTIVLSHALLIMANVGELTAILANLLFYIYKPYGVLFHALYFTNLPLIWANWLYKKYLALVKRVTIILGGAGFFVSLFLYIPVVVLLPVIALAYIGRMISNFVFLALVRNCEYKADKFAANLGYAEDLISYLNKLNLMDEYKNNLSGVLLSCQNAPGKRIARLEKLNHKFNY